MRKKLLWIRIFFIVSLFWGASLGASSESPPVFTDVTAEAGVEFQHSFGDEDMSSILESTGSGCAFFDYDNDGYIDLYVVNGCYLEGISDADSPHKGVRLTNHLYRNNGDGTFTDVTEEAGVGDEGYGMACVAGDYDNDGDTDIYVTNYGGNTLYRNNGDGTFTDVTKEAGVGDTLWGVGATFFDYDNDGDLDLYVGNYLEFDPEYRLYYEADEFPGPLAYPGQPDVLYRNNGDGTFTDVTKTAGVLNEGRAMGVLSTDYDNDGWVDLFVANDAMENYLYHNNGDGTFTDVGIESGTAFSEHGDATASMGGDFGDIDFDGDLDLLVPDMTFNSVYRNLGNGYFEDMSVILGVAELSGQYWSWGGDFFDYDNDGDLDIIIANGDGHHLEDTQEELIMANIALPNGERVFQDIAGQSGAYFRHKSVSRGMAVGDYDNDGDLDVFVLNIDQPSVLLRNDGGNRNNWLMFNLVGAKSNRDGLGARVTVKAGNWSLFEEKKSATSYLSQNDPRLHFGLGNRNQADEVIIKWPSGITQRLTNVKANQVVTVKEPAE
ncbi:MAG: CRTAC1 family protein [Candidatus Poribacteria bacterium]